MTIAPALRHACPVHGPTVPRARGVRLGEVLGVLVITFLTCGLGGILVLGLIPLARRQVCPVCSTPTFPTPSDGILRGDPAPTRADPPAPPTTPRRPSP